MSDNNTDHQGSKAMWLMMIFCSLPLIISLSGAGSAGKYNWLTLVIIGVVVAGHFWLMRKGHCGQQSRNNDENHTHAPKIDDKKSNSPTHEHKNRCCH